MVELLTKLLRHYTKETELLTRQKSLLNTEQFLNNTLVFCTHGYFTCIATYSNLCVVYIVRCQGVAQLGGLVLVWWQYVPLRYKASKSLLFATTRQFCLQTPLLLEQVCSSTVFNTVSTLYLPTYAV